MAVPEAAIEVRYLPAPADHPLRRTAVSDLQVQVERHRLIELGVPSLTRSTILVHLDPGHPAYPHDDDEPRRDGLLAFLTVIEANPCVRDGEVEDIVGDCDQLSFDLAQLAEQVFWATPAGRARVEAASGYTFEPCDEILLVDMFWISPAWRGTILTQALAAAMLGRAVLLSQLYPAPTVLTAAPFGLQLSQRSRLRVRAHLRGLWGSLGFTPFQHKLHLGACLGVYDLHRTAERTAAALPGGWTGLADAVTGPGPARAP